MDNVKTIGILFKSIQLLHDEMDLQHEVAMLEKKLEICFDEVVDKGGFKKCWDIAYYPNGLCENNEFAIALSPWSSHSIPIEGPKVIKKKSKPKMVKTCYKALEAINPMWYFQLKEYAKSSYTGNEKWKDILPYEKTYQTYQELNSMPADTKAILQAEMRILRIEADSILSLLFNSFQTIHLLTEEELEGLYKIARLTPDDAVRTQTEMQEYLDGISCTNKHFPLKLRDFNDFPHENYSYSAYYEAMSDDFLAWLQSITNPNARNVLKKLNIIA
jgi:hypothetical protein